jgi:hypothetical protein
MIAPATRSRRAFPAWSPFTWKPLPEFGLKFFGESPSRSLKHDNRNAWRYDWTKKRNEFRKLFGESFRDCLKTKILTFNDFLVKLQVKVG